MKLQISKVFVRHDPCPRPPLPKNEVWTNRRNNPDVQKSTEYGRKYDSKRQTHLRKKSTKHDLRQLISGPVTSPLKPLRDLTPNTPSPFFVNILTAQQ